MDLAGDLFSQTRCRKSSCSSTGWALWWM
jgi:hypothetical protein